MQELQAMLEDYINGIPSMKGSQYSDGLAQSSVALVEHFITRIQPVFADHSKKEAAVNQVHFELTSQYSSMKKLTIRIESLLTGIQTVDSSLLVLGDKSQVSGIKQYT